MYRYILNKYLENEELVSVYTKDDNEKFVVGFIKAVSREMFLLELRTPNGNYDGMLLNRIEDLHRIETKGKYLEKINILCKAKGTNLSRYDCINAENLLEYLLGFAQKNSLIISIETDSDYDVGFVRNCNSNFIELETLDEYGKLDLTVYVPKEEITHVEYYSESMNCYEILYKAKNI